MSNLTLGIDLGTNSIGWAIRDIMARDNQIIKKGVLIFDKGVGEEKGITKIKKTPPLWKRRGVSFASGRRIRLLGAVRLRRISAPGHDSESSKRFALRQMLPCSASSPS